MTQDGAGRLAGAPVPPPSSGAPAAPLEVGGAAAVAEGYVASRLTYRFDDPAGYTAAVTSPAFTTPGFAARSTPSAAMLARLATSGETSAVRVEGAAPAGEAPDSATTRYVVVTCTVTTTYRGGQDTAGAAWTLRLLRADAGRWRVDGVLSTD